MYNIVKKVLSYTIILSMVATTVFSSASTAFASGLAVGGSGNLSGTSYSGNYGVIGLKGAPNSALGKDYEYNDVLWEIGLFRKPDTYLLPKGGLVAIQNAYDIKYPVQADNSLVMCSYDMYMDLQNSPNGVSMSYYDGGSKVIKAVANAGILARIRNLKSRVNAGHTAGDGGVFYKYMVNKYEVIPTNTGKKSLTELANGNWKSLGYAEAGWQGCWDQCLDTLDWIFQRQSGDKFAVTDRVNKFLNSEGLNLNDLSNIPEEKLAEIKMRYLDFMMVCWFMMGDGSAREQWAKAIEDWITGSNLTETPVTIAITPSVGVECSVNNKNQKAIVRVIDYINYIGGIEVQYMMNRNTRPNLSSKSTYDAIVESISNSIISSPNLFRPASQWSKSEGFGWGRSVITGMLNGKYGTIDIKSNQFRWYTANANRNKESYLDVLYFTDLARGFNLILSIPISNQQHKIKLSATPKETTVKGDTINQFVELSVRGANNSSEISQWQPIIDESNKTGQMIQLEFKFNRVTPEGTYEACQPNPIMVSGAELQAFLSGTSEYLFQDTQTKDIAMADGDTLELEYTCTLDITFKGKVMPAQDKDGVSFTKKEGLISYASEPQTWSEIKEGKPRNESWEAMAGVPSTETLYFASGGSEFIVEVDLEYIKDTEVERKYKSVFNGTDCEYKEGDTVKSGDVHGAPDHGGGEATGDYYTTGPYSKGAHTHSYASCTDSHPPITYTYTAASDGVTRTITIKPTCTRIRAKTTHVTGGHGTHGSGEKSKPCKCHTGCSTVCEYEHRYIIPIHVLCGPCCQHYLPEVSDTWTQKLTYDHLRIVNAHVWKIDRSVVDGMTEITKESTDEIYAGIKQGDPNIFFNIASTETSKEGRLRYTIEAQQHDDVVWNENSSQGNHRTNHCNGIISNKSANPSCPTNGHVSAWADGILYNNTAYGNEENYHNNSSPGVSTGIANRADAKDKLTEEWKRFDERRKTIVKVDVVSDMLILQTSSGDQSVMYFDKMSEPKETQQNFDKVEASKEEMWDNNPNSAYKWKPKQINIGSYNGKYNNPSIKYDGSGTGKQVQTVFDGKYGSTFNTNSTSSSDPAATRSSDNKSKVAAPLSYKKPASTVGGKSLSSPSSKDGYELRMSRVKDMLLYEDKIKQKITNVNKSYLTGEAEVFWKSILDYCDGAYVYDGSVRTNAEQKRFNNVHGFTMESNYSDRHGKINDIVVHDPVSTEYAVLESLPAERDQRATLPPGGAEDTIDKRAESEVCPRDPGLCEFRILDCTYFKDRAMASFNFDTFEKSADGKFIVTDSVSGRKYTLPNGFTISNGKLVAKGNRWGINLVQLGLSYNANNKIRMSMDYEADSGATTLGNNFYVAGFKAVGVKADDQNRATFVTGAAPSERRANDVYLRGAGKYPLQIDFNLASIDDCVIYKNGVPASSYTRVANSRELKPELFENTLYIGAPADAKDGSASFTIDNLVITKLSGTTEHNDSCYRNVTFHETKTYHICDENCYTSKDEYVTCTNELNAGSIPGNIGNCTCSHCGDRRCSNYCSNHRYSCNGTCGVIYPVPPTPNNRHEHTVECGFIAKGTKRCTAIPNTSTKFNVHLHTADCLEGEDGENAEILLHLNNNFDDSSMNKRVVEVSKTNTIGSGKFNGSALFTGERSYLSLKDVKLRDSNKWTIEGQVKYNSTNKQQLVLYNEDATSVNSPFIRFDINGDKTNLVIGRYINNKDTETTQSKNDMAPVEFGFTGNVQQWTAPADGEYLLEAWGAQGGGEERVSASVRTNPEDEYAVYENITFGSKGGQGGYTKGKVYLKKGQTIYIYVGGAGTVSSNPTGGWNGGGSAYCTVKNTESLLRTDTVGSGGGATDFRLSSGTWNNLTSLQSRILVAGGGGGSDDVGDHTSGRKNQDEEDGTGGAGGSLIGQSGLTRGTPSSVGGGGQTKDEAKYNNGVNGSFGIGGTNTKSDNDFGGGGGGYYGGASGMTIANAGSGGSSFVTGYNGCDNTYRDKHNNLDFTDVEMKQGGNTGNGKAKISAASNSFSTTGTDNAKWINKTIKTPEAGKWHHIAVSYDGGDTYYVAIDGAVGKFTSSYVGYMPRQNNENPWIGRSNENKYSRMYLDEYRIFKEEAKFTKNFEVPDREYVTGNTGGNTCVSTYDFGDGSKNGITNGYINDAIYIGDLEPVVPSGYAGKGNISNSQLHIADWWGKAEYGYKQLNIRNGGYPGFNSEPGVAQRIYAGSNSFPISYDTSNKLLTIDLISSCLTCTGEFSNLYVQFNGNKYTVNDAIKAGYVEPLVIANTGTNSSYQMSTPLNILSGGSTGSNYWGVVSVHLNVKDTPCTAVYVNTNMDSKAGDGVKISSHDVKIHLGGGKVQGDIYKVGDKWYYKGYPIEQVLGNNWKDYITTKEVVGPGSGEKKTYNYTGKLEEISLRPGKYTFELYGAQGGGNNDAGYGGYSKGTIEFKTNTTLILSIGQNGNSAGFRQSAFGGGGIGRFSGGGATDIRTNTTIQSRIIVAGGGGATGPAAGGAGGGANMAGGDGVVRCGTAGRGGTLTTGGAGGSKHGYFGVLGVGGTAGGCNYTGNGAGGGGGGYYGGGGGGHDCPKYNDNDDSGGGGGSGYANTSLFTDISGKNGVNSGNGKIIITTESVMVEVSTIDKDKIIANINTIPNFMPDGSLNPIYYCNNAPYNAHVCNDKCSNKRLLTCGEPHHNGLHYDGSNPICWKACCNDANHKNYKSTVTKPDGNIIAAGTFVNIDYGFRIYFPNIGDFDQGEPHGISSLTDRRGLGFVDRLDTTKWTREKRIRFSFNVLYERTKGNWEQYNAGEWIELEVGDNNENNNIPGPYYNFYCLLANYEAKSTDIECEVEAINCPPGNEDDPWLSNEERDNDNLDAMTNRFRNNKFLALHGGFKTIVTDVVGRIGNLTISDTGDFRFCNFFKVPQSCEASCLDRNSGIECNHWIVEGVIRTVHEDTQNLYLAKQSVNGSFYDIRGEKIESSRFYLNTYGTQDWLDKEPVGGPLAASKNNIDVLKTQTLRPGYDILFDVQTIGNYQDRLQVVPYYYALNLETRQLTPVDVYMYSNSRYEPINMFGVVGKEEADYFGNQAESSRYITTGEGWDTAKEKLYSYSMNLDWVAEQGRRNYSMLAKGETGQAGNKIKVFPEKYITDKLAEKMKQKINDEAGNHLGDRAYPIPLGRFYNLGNAQLLTPTGQARTFIGSERTNDWMTNVENKLSLEQYWYAAQRWHLKLGLPSSALFVEYTPEVRDSNGVLVKEEIRLEPNEVTTSKFTSSDDEKYAIIMAVDIKAIGDNYVLQYGAYNKTVEADEKNRNLVFEPNNAVDILDSNGVSHNYDLSAIKWPVLAVYSPSLPSSNDIDIKGTH